MLQRGDRVAYAKDNKLIRTTVVKHCTAESQNPGQDDYHAVILADGSIHKRDDVILLAGSERYGMTPQPTITVSSSCCPETTAREVSDELRRQFRKQRPNPRATVREVLDKLRREIRRGNQS